MNYQLELKQIVDFPRCRIYREFIQTLMKDRSIRTNGGSCLFYFLILCSYANYSSSYRNIEHLTYKVVPGEWICSLKELQIHFRQKFQHQVISILDTLVEQNLLTYSLHEKNKIIQYKIKDWPKDNTALSHNYPCKKDIGFFFFPIADVHKLIGLGKCSEMDALLDLWIHAVYNDPSVQGSDAGPVVYFRNQTGNPLFSYQELARRWKQSKSSVSRLLKKLEDTDMITLISYSGKHGSMVYLRNYLSVMFNISDAHGIAASAADALPLGHYRIEETKAPSGYLTDGAKALEFDITQNGEIVDLTTEETSVSNQIIRGGVKIQKRDLETGEAKPQGNASLKDAEFTITNLGPNPVLVDETLYEKDQVVLTLKTDEKGLASTKKDTLPYGHYRGDETKAPEGYLNEGKLSQEFHITENGKILDLTAKETAISNQVIRGDLEFVKVSDGDLNRLANVPFSITSKTTGESHTIVTDKNGYASTSSEWNKHTTNTNRGETSEDGIWFGSSKPDDTKGALIYDTYILEEQRCDSNEGMNLLKIEVSVYKNHVVVDMGTLTDDQITIGTTALDKDSNSHFAKPEEKITLVDTVEYEGLKKGQSYKLIGTLMDQESGKPIEIDGKPVTAETTFKPKKSSGSAKVTFTFNASSLKGKTIVVFEELYQEDLKLAVHADITDQDQTIYFPEIGTTAKDKETDMNLSQADKEVTLVDTVAYKNLLPGEEYVMTGTLMDKETGKPVEIDKKAVTAETTFTPKESSGTVDVIFSFDGTSLAGKTVVVFESATYDGKEFATHADLEDNGQTIYFPEIATTAKDKADGDHFAKTDKEITIVDTVKYSNLIPGKEYALTGTLMDKETKEPLQADGKPITATTTFTPEDASGSIELTFTFDGSILSGKTIVVFESLTYQEKEIAVHADIEDHEQSIYFPGIGTTAKDKADGDQEAVATKEVTIIDTISYQNLIPDTPYKLVGTLMDKTTQKEVMIDGKPVTAETEFTPKDSNGSVEVIFTFDGSTLAGHDVVVFEKLFSLEGETALEIASHEDLDDKGQTIKLTEAPKDTPEPSKPVKTGDETTVLPYLLLAGAALLFAAGFGILYIRKRKKDK